MSYGRQTKRTITGVTKNSFIRGLDADEVAAAAAAAAAEVDTAAVPSEDGTAAAVADEKVTDAEPSSYGFLNGGATAAASASASAAALPSPLSQFSVNAADGEEIDFPVANPDPSELVYISATYVPPAVAKAAQPAEEEATQIADMDLFVDNFSDEVSQAATLDDMIGYELGKVAKGCYLMEWKLENTVLFTNSKTGRALTRALIQHKVLRINLARSHIFSQTDLNVGVLGSHPFLQRLDLTGSELTPAQLVILLFNLSRSQSLLVLSLRHVIGKMKWNKEHGLSLSEDDLRDIFTAIDVLLRENNSITHLDLSGNLITSKEYKLFAANLFRRPFKKLDLSHNALSTKDFCLSLRYFLGESLIAKNCIRDDKIENHDAAKQICHTLVSNKTLTELDVEGASKAWNSDAQIYEAFLKNSTLTSLSIKLKYNVSRAHDGTSENCADKLCALIDSKKPLEKLKVYFPNAIGLSERIYASVLRNPRLTLFDTGHPVPEAVKAAVEAKQIANQETVTAERSRWKQISVFTSFVRANLLPGDKPHPFSLSIKPIMPSILDLAK